MNLLYINSKFFPSDTNFCGTKYKSLNQKDHEYLF